MGVDNKKRRLVSEAKVIKVKKDKVKFRFSLFNFLVMSTVFVIVGFFVFNIIKSVVESVDLYNQNLALESRINELYYEKEMLLVQQENLLSDAEIELMAKEKLGLIKPGEVVYVLDNIN
ncbi:MAG: septum formation initiator family protein [Firmicutes bacterium]|nr:septum formation initiator family protein [Bacillota bacterium]